MCFINVIYQNKVINDPPSLLAAKKASAEITEIVTTAALSSSNLPCFQRSSTSSLTPSWRKPTSWRWPWASWGSSCSRIHLRGTTARVIHSVGGSLCSSCPEAPRETPLPSSPGLDLFRGSSSSSPPRPRDQSSSTQWSIPPPQSPPPSDPPPTPRSRTQELKAQSGGPGRERQWTEVTLKPEGNNGLYVPRYVGNMHFQPAQPLWVYWAPIFSSHWWTDVWHICGIFEVRVVTLLWRMFFSLVLSN